MAHVGWWQIGMGKLKGEAEVREDEEDYGIDKDLESLLFSLKF